MGTSNKGTEDPTPVDIPCRLDPNKDVQLKTLAKIRQGSRQPNLANKVISTQKAWFVTRHININIIIIIIIIIIIMVNTITIIILKFYFITFIVNIFIAIICNIIIVIIIVKALCNICKKDNL